MDVLGDGLLVLGGKHPHVLQFLFQLLVALVEQAFPVREDFTGVKLVFPIPLIDRNGAKHDDVVPIFHGKGKASAVSGKQHTVQRPCLILQCEIYVAGSVVFAVGYFSLDIDTVHHKILGEHIFDISIDLAYGIYVLRHTNFASTPLPKEGESSLP